MEKNILEQILEGSMEPTNLPLETLREITDGFSTSRIIGEGGFGTVYKGIVRNKSVAVKRIKSSMTIDDKLFRREVNSLMEVNHENVVRFLGLCSHTIEKPVKIPESRGHIYVEIRERLLCFEYISNGSLDKKITDELRGLEWDKRYKIIKGICTGLHYLHVEKRILHMDLKPANILLDNDMLPKITDFGLSRPVENSQTMSKNNFVSLGYCSPENFFGRGRMSVQSDMYSLGVIIIELVTGHKGIPDNDDNILRRWRHRWHKSKKETPLKYLEEVTKCIEIGSLCQKVDPYARPSISEIMSKFAELESMDNCRIVAHESTVGQIKLPYWEDDMLGVEPLELQFANSGNEKQLLLSCKVELNNDTDSFIAFKIETTSPLPYSIEPNRDVLKPRSKCSVDITLPAVNIQDHNNNKYTKDFMVRSIKVNEGLTTNDMNAQVFDKNFTGHHVDEIYLSVISEEPCNKEVTDSSVARMKQSPGPSSCLSVKQYGTVATVLQSSKELGATPQAMASVAWGLATLLVTGSPTKQAMQYASSETMLTPIRPGSMQLVIKNNTVAPLFKHNIKVMLELTGGDYTSDRPGLDLVAVVEVSWYMGGDRIEQLKTALQFMVGKLRPIDRLCIIKFTYYSQLCWPLQQITEASQRVLHDLISKLQPIKDRADSRTSLKDALDVLARRQVRLNRVAGIMLVSSGKNENSDMSVVDFGDVPVYTFCFGSTDSCVAAKSMGGTFTHVVDQDTGSLTMAFSQWLACLLTIPSQIQNLELSVAAGRGEAKIVKVTAGSYPQKQDRKGSVTVRFGKFYTTEVRKVIVELVLPAIYRDRSAEILDVTYSHNWSAGRMTFVAPTETLTVWRTGVEFSDKDKHANSLLSTELQELLELFKTQKTYKKQGRPYALPWESSHDRQRMDKSLEQAKKFLNKPTMLLPSVEEVDALGVNVASREEEIRRLALDVVRLPDKHPGWIDRRPAYKEYYFPTRRLPETLLFGKRKILGTPDEVNVNDCVPGAYFLMGER